MRILSVLTLAVGVGASPALASGEGSGCCSDHGGVACCDADGTVTCEDGAKSSCTCTMELEGPEDGEEAWEGGVESNDGSDSEGGETRDPNE